MKSKIATQNACKLCTPLGACLAFKGTEGTIPLLHGSQGCATYIRRYTISHYREPVDIASTSFTEDSAIFGGGRNLREAMNNLIDQYQPKAIGIATTCLSETIGEDMGLLLSEYAKAESDRKLPKIVRVSTPSYQGTHAEGYWAAIGSLLSQLPVKTDRKREGAVLTPGMISPADLRHLKDLFALYDYPLTLMGDYSETLDGGVWEEYQKISPGGTPLEEIEKAGEASFALDFSALGMAGGSAPLVESFGTPRETMPQPIGLQLSDRFHRSLREQTGREIPKRVIQERSRLMDAYTDGHKYCFGKRAVVFGDAELVLSMAVFLEETGVVPVLCATGSEAPGLKNRLQDELEFPERVRVETDLDFDSLEQVLQEGEADFMIGNSKGYKLAQLRDLPLIRVGFPIHDRFGASRVQTLDYSGSLELYDKVINVLMELKQKNSDVGYTYI